MKVLRELLREGRSFQYTYVAVVGVAASPEIKGDER